MLMNRNLLQRQPSPTPVGPEVAPSQPAPEKPRGNRVWVLFGLGLFAVLAVGGYLLYQRQVQNRAQSAALRPLRVFTVRPGPLEKTIRLTGNTVAENSAVLRAPYLRGRRSSSRSGDFGLVLEKMIAPGTKVKKGDSVATFDRQYMQRRLDDYAADRADAQLTLSTLRAENNVALAAFDQELRQAKADMDKAAVDLRTAPVRSAIQASILKLDYEEYKATFAALTQQRKYMLASQQADMRVAQLLLREAEVEESRALANADKLVVRAPVAGLFIAQEIRRGTDLVQVRAGDQLYPGQAFAQIVDLDKMIVEATASQVDVEQLRIGTKAHLHFDAYPKLTLPGRVFSVGPLARISRRRSDYVSSVPVFLKLDGEDPRVIPNLAVSADVITEQEKSEGIMPREAVVRERKTGSTFALLRTPSGWEKREVDLGMSNNVDIAVKVGLAPGDVVATALPPASTPAPAKAGSL